MAEPAYPYQPSIDPDAVREELDRILASKIFAATASLTRLLRYIVCETLEGRHDGLKELNLGMCVFTRGDAFDPRIDPIVRVQARNLRARLQRYYAGPGASDSILIDLPKGSYVPVFSGRPAPAPAPVPISVEAATPPLRRRGAPGWVVASACLLVLLCAGFLYQRYRTGVTPTHAPARPSPSQATASEARALYIRGRYLLDRQTDDALQKSLACFRDAVALDPGYAAAWAGIADAYDVMSQFGFLAPADGMAEARKAANKALSLDPNLAEAHQALAAIIEAYDWNWKAAEREYKRAIELNPALAGAHAWYGMFLRDQGRLAQAIPELEAAYRLDPVSVLTLINLASAYATNGNLDAAIRHARICAEIEPSSPKPLLILAGLYRKTKQDDLSQDAFNRARELSGRNPRELSNIALAYARTGRKAEARKMLDELHGMSRQRYVSSYDIASVYMALQDFDRALPYLEAAYRERATGLLCLRDGKYREAYRSSRRFRELVSRLRFDS